MNPRVSGYSYISLQKAAIKHLSERTKIEEKYFSLLKLSLPECTAITEGYFFSLPIVRDQKQHNKFVRFDNISFNHYTGIKIVDDLVYIENDQYIIDSRFFDADSIKKFCKRNGYDCN